jgi:hypothetical protein
VFGNRVLRRIFVPKKDEGLGGWSKFHNELYNLYSLPDVRVIKSRRMRLEEHVVHVGDIRNAYRIWLEHLKGTDDLEDLSIDGRLILKLM